MSSVELWLARAVDRISEAPLGRYQTAIIRIGFSLTWLLFLLREFPHRQELYGPDAPWSWTMGQRLVQDNGAFTALLWTDSQAWFEIVYVLAIASSVLLLLGWHTRTMSVLFMVGVLSLENRSIFVSDGGDNVIHLMAIYLVLTRCGSVWSLDVRRARRNAAARAAGLGARADVVGPVLWGVLGAALLVVSVLGKMSGGWLLVYWGLWVAQGLWWTADRRSSRTAAPAADLEPAADPEPATETERTGATGPVEAPGPVGAPPQQDHRKLLDVIANMAHNAALFVIMAEACLIYATAGWYKIQGGRWEDGTAVYYPLHLDYFSPWPALSHLLGEHGLIVLVITYGTVIMQVAFPFTLLNRRAKNVLLVGMMCEHTVIAITLGLPFFSLAMIAADSVFLPTSFLTWLGRTVARGWAVLLPGTRPSKEAGAQDGAYGTGGSADSGGTETGRTPAQVP